LQGRRQLVELAFEDLIEVVDGDLDAVVGDAPLAIVVGADLLGPVARAHLGAPVGRELGLAEQQLLELQYAALIHDIGQLSLPDPIPGGATVLVSPDDQRQIAELGAEVIEQANMLDSVAEIVRRQSDPCRDQDTASPGPPPLSSRIIRAVNAFDDLVGTSVNPARATEVVERLRLDTSAEYDPRVVEALARVVARRTPGAGSVPRP